MGLQHRELKGEIRMDPGDVLSQSEAQGIQEESTPSKSLKTLYTLYLLIIVWIGILPWLIPLAFIAPPLLTLGVSLIVFTGVVCALWWIRAFYRSIRYRFTTTGIMWEQGVWSHRTGIVPYQQIARVEVRQGLLSRILGISDLDIQTASPSGGSSRYHGARIRGIADPQPLLALIRNQAEREG